MPESVGDITDLRSNLHAIGAENLGVELGHTVDFFFLSVLKYKVLHKILYIKNKDQPGLKKKNNSLFFNRTTLERHLPIHVSNNPVGTSATPDLLKKKKV